MNIEITLHKKIYEGGTLGSHSGCLQESQLVGDAFYFIYTISILSKFYTKFV